MNAQAVLARPSVGGSGVILDSGARLAANDNELYRRLVDSVSDYAIYMLDAAGYVSSWNPGAKRFKGYEAEEIIGQHFSRFYTEEDRCNGRPEQALGIAAGEGRFEDRAWRVRKDGTRFRAHVIIDPVREPDGRLIGYAKITRDVTETWEREQELQRSEQRFRLLVSGVTDYAIYLIDLGGHINSWNAGAERFKNYKAEEVLGRHFSLFYTDEDRANGRPARALGKALREGRYEETGWRVRKDGTRFWANVVIDLLRDEAGEPMGFAKITRDVSERRAAELRMQELTSNNAELEQFIHVASHDLREPLRKVLSYSDLLLEDEGDRLSADGRQYIASITSATRRMQALLASLLDLSRVTSQGRSFDPIALDTVLGEVCSDLRVAITERQVTIDIGPLPRIEADEAQMRQLFQNLIENAIKYSRAGVAPRISIREIAEPVVEADCAGDTDPKFVVIECRDNGIGFEQQYAERIFGVFQRLHTRDQYGGAGIGLAIVRKICRRHGGEIGAEGRPGEGATFTLRLRRRHLVDGQ